MRECERRDEFIQGAQMDLEGDSTDFDLKWANSVFHLVMDYLLFVPF